MKTDEELHYFLMGCLVGAICITILTIADTSMQKSNRTLEEQRQELEHERGGEDERFKH